MQVPGRLPGRCRLGGMELSFPQLRYGDRERGQPCIQCPGGNNAAWPSRQGHEPGQGAQPVTVRSRVWDAPVRCTSGPAVAVRGAAQHMVAQRPRGQRSVPAAAQAAPAA